MLNKDTTYNVSVVTELKNFEDVEFNLLNENIQEPTNMIISGNLGFTLKPKNNNDLNALWNQIIGVPQRDVSIQLIFQNNALKITLKIMNCDDKIYTDFLTINGIIWELLK